MLKYLKKIRKYIITTLERGKKIIKNYCFILDSVCSVGLKYILILISIALLGAIFPIVTLFLSKKIVNTLVTPPQDINIYNYIIGIILISVIVQFISRFTDSIRSCVSNFTVALVEKKIKLSILIKASSVDLKTVESKKYYFILDNARRAVGRRWDSLVLAPVNLMSHIITLVGLIGILVILNHWIVIILIIGILPNICLQIKLRNMMNNLYTSQLNENRKLNYIEKLLTDKLYAKEIRLFNMSERLLNEFKELFDEKYKKINKNRFKELILTGTFSLIGFLTMGICEIIIAIYVIKGEITIGDWSLYVGTLQSINFSLNTIVNIIANSYEEKLFSTVLKDFLEIESDMETDGEISIKCDSPKKIEFRNVSFCYPDTDRYVLKDISFEIKEGDKIALVGLNGAGKTTLVKLLSGLYKPQSGKVLYDGVDISMYKKADIYKMIGVVFQDFNKYGFTLKDNVVINPEVVDEDRYQKSIEVSGIDELIQKLPEVDYTYMTKEYENKGITNISGGEWQKVAIARCLYRNAAIMILDEPTANLDPLAEHRIYQKFLEISQNKTTFVITHRLSSVTMCDYILFLQDGKIIEQGSHKKLLDQKGEYANLFNLQAEKYKL